MKKLRKRVLGNRRYAAAIQYRRENDPAPRLTAKGAGMVAEKIIAAAIEAGVPVYEDQDLVALLMTLDMNDFIPPEMYLAVAEVLAFNGRDGEWLAKVAEKDAVRYFDVASRQIPKEQKIDITRRSVDAYGEELGNMSDEELAREARATGTGESNGNN